MGSRDNSFCRDRRKKNIEKKGENARLELDSREKECDRGSTKRARMPDVANAIARQGERLNSVGGSG